MIKSSKNMCEAFSIGSIIACGAAGVMAIAYATAVGPVIFSDSVGYLAAARNILAGYGIGVFEASGRFGVMTFHPPFYPLLVAFLGLSGVDVVAITRWLHALCFGLIVFLTGFGLLRLARSLVLALCAAVAVLVSPLLLHLFCLAMTEPTFFVLSLLAFLSLWASLEKDHLGWLMGAAMFVGLSVMTRLVGVAWLVVGVGVIGLFWQGDWKRRARAWSVFSIVGLLPLVVWWGWVTWIVRPPSRIAEYIPWTQRLVEARLAIVNIFWQWLPFSEHLPVVHYRLKLVMLLVLAASNVGLVIAATQWAKRKALGSGLPWRQNPIIRVAALLWLSLLAYLAVVVFGYALSTPTPDLNERTLSMGLWLGGGLIFVGCAAIYQAWPRSPWKHAFPLAGASLMVAAALPQSVLMLNDYHREGAGYLSVRWQQSGVVLALKNLPTDLPLISNEHSVLTFWLGRPVYPLQEVVSLEPQPLDERYGDDPTDPSQAVFRQQGAALVLFDDLRWQLGPLYGEDTEQRIAALTHGLRLAGDYWDGKIYFYPATQP